MLGVGLKLKIPNIKIIAIRQKSKFLINVKKTFMYLSIFHNFNLSLILTVEYKVYL